MRGFRLLGAGPGERSGASVLPACSRNRPAGALALAGEGAGHDVAVAVEGGRDGGVPGGDLELPSLGLNPASIIRLMAWWRSAWIGR
jgi:hypothetical protein